MLYANLIMTQAFTAAGLNRIQTPDAALTPTQIAEKVTLRRVFQGSSRVSAREIEYNGHTVYLRSCPSVPDAQDLLDLVDVIRDNGFSGHVVSAGVWDYEAKAPLGMTRVTTTRQWDEVVPVYQESEIVDGEMVWKHETGTTTVTRSREDFVRFDGTETYPMRVDLLIQLVPERYIDGVMRNPVTSDIFTLAIHGRAREIREAFGEA